MLSFPEMRKVRGLKGHTASVLSVALDRQQRWVATGGQDAVACLWDTQVGAGRGGEGRAGWARAQQVGPVVAPVRRWSVHPAAAYAGGP